MPCSAKSVRQGAFTVLLVLVLAIFAVRSQAEPAAAPPLRARQLAYVFEPVVNPVDDSLRLRVRVTFSGEATGTTRLNLPFAWAGLTRLDKGIANLRAASPNTVVHDTEQEQTKTVSYPPNQPVCLTYDAVVKKPETGDDPSYQSSLEKEYFHFIGHHYLVAPDWDQDVPVPATLQWSALPPGYALANSFGVNARRQTLRASLRTLRDAVYVGGDYRLQRVLVKNKPVYVALRGRPRFSDQEFAGVVEKIVTLERAFWNDYDFPYYLLTLSPRGTGAWAGMRLKNSFSLSVPADAQLDLGLKLLVAHELFHVWNGEKIRWTPVLGDWFAESLTEQYARLILLRAGMMSLGEYVDKYNDALSGYYTSPVRTIAAEKLQANLFAVRDGKRSLLDIDLSSYRLPYWRGDVLAHHWNAVIRRTSGGKHGFEDVLRDLRAASKDGTSISQSTLTKVLSRYLPADVRETATAYLSGTRLIPADKNALGPGVDLISVEVAPFEEGYDFAIAAAKKMVAGVKENSNAYRAGLRNGQQIVDEDIVYNRPGRLAKITVKDAAGAQQVVSYYPAGPKVFVPQYKVTSGFQQNPRRGLAWFGAALR